MKDGDIHRVVGILRRETRRWKEPAVGAVSDDDPFQVLASTLLSLRTKDATTEAASLRLFKLARTPRGG